MDRMPPQPIYAHEAPPVAIDLPADEGRSSLVSKVILGIVTLFVLGLGIFSYLYWPYFFYLAQHTPIGSINASDFAAVPVEKTVSADPLVLKFPEYSAGGFSFRTNALLVDKSSKYDGTSFSFLKKRAVQVMKSPKNLQQFDRVFHSPYISYNSLVEQYGAQTFQTEYDILSQMFKTVPSDVKLLFPPAKTSGAVMFMLLKESYTNFGGSTPYAITLPGAGLEGFEVQSKEFKVATLNLYDQDENKYVITISGFTEPETEQIISSFQVKPALK